GRRHRPAARAQPDLRGRRLRPRVVPGRLRQPHPCDAAWRVGWDAGAIWGTDKADIRYSDLNLTTANANPNQIVPIDPATVYIKHRTGYVWGALGAIHSDLEIPCGNFILYAGVRAEYTYTFTNVIQRQNNGNVHAINVLGTVGLRF